mgnify:FL=1|jgi:hypothetical protein
MMTILTSIAPILGGFLMKLFALNQQAKAEQHTQMLDAFAARSNSIEQARVAASKESPIAALNRRLIIWVMLTLIVLYVSAPLFLDIPTAVPIVHEGISFLGFDITSDTVEYTMVRGLVKYDEIFEWTSLIVEMYFGSSLAKGR